MQVLTQTSQPSWGWWVTQVLVIHAALLRFMCSLPCLAPQPLQNHATSLFEMWGAFHGLNKTGIASRNHIMFGSFLPWLWQGLGGLVSSPSPTHTPYLEWHDNCHLTMHYCTSGYGS